MKALVTVLVGTIITFIAEAHTADPLENAYTEIVSLEKVPIIEVSLNGKSAYFVLDSGSDVSLLHLPDALNFEFSHQKRASKSIVGASGGNQPLYQASDFELLLGQRPLQTMFFATDLATIIESLAASTGITITGIIGMDLMRKYGFEIDYLNQRLVLHW